jgi:uncharacterized protein involved in cysteine biosynthesis
MRSTLGFKAALGTLPKAFGFLAHSPALWVWAAAPGLLLAGLAALDVALVVAFVPDWLARILPQTTSWYGKVASSSVILLGSVAIGLFGLFVAVFLAPILSAPALERLVRARERALGVPTPPEIGLLREFVSGLRAALLGAAIALPLLFVLTLLDLFLPAAALVTAPLKFMIVALSLAWSLIDYPLTLRGVAMRERLGLFRRYPAALFGFGLCFALLFWAPCCSVLLLSVGVVAATDLIWGMVAQDPKLGQRFNWQEPRDAGAARNNGD